MRKGIAAKMTRVKQTVPHAYTVVEIDMGNVVRWREANTAAYKTREGIGISYVAVVIKVLSQPPVPFAVSFTGAFIALHLIEALALRRLFAS